MTLIKKERIEELNKLMEETNFGMIIKAQDIINEKRIIRDSRKSELLKSKIVLDLSDEELNFALKLMNLKMNFLLKHMFYLVVHMIKIMQFLNHPGAGNRSMDWASMLYRMYLRWAETKVIK